MSFFTAAEGSFSREKSGPEVLTVFLLVTMAAVATRISPSFERALWFDESFSIYYVQKGLSYIWGQDWRLEPTPPLYYSLLHLWSKLFGLEEWVLRSLSLILSSLAGGVIFLATREIAGLRAGVIAGLLWGVMPLAIEYGVELRAYALEFLIIALMMLVLFRLVKGIDQQIIAGWRAFLPKAAQLTLLGLAASYTHITAILVFGTFSLLLGFYLLYRMRRDPGQLVAWGVCNFIYLLGLIPQLVATNAVMTKNAPTIAWLTTPSFEKVIAVARAQLVGNAGWGEWEPRAVLLVWACSAIGSIYLLRRRPIILYVTLGLSLLGGLVFLIFSQFQPIFLNRTLLWVTIPGVAFIGAGLSCLPPKGAKLAAAVLIASVGTVSLISLKERVDFRGDYRGVMEMAGRLQPRDLIATVDGELACQVDYFARPVYQRVRLIDLQGAQSFVRTQAVDLSCNRPPKMIVSTLPERLEAQARVWVIGRAPYYDNGARIRADVDKIVDQLTASGGRIVEHIENRSFVAIAVAPAR